LKGSFVNTVLFLKLHLTTLQTFQGNKAAEFGIRKKLDPFSGLAEKNGLRANSLQRKKT